MGRTFRQTRRAIPVVSLAALSVLAAGTSAHASGACPDPAVEATVNIDGTEVAGCRAIYGVSTSETPPRSPAISGQARILAVGGGGGGGNMNMGPDGLVTPLAGGGGGAGGQVVTKMMSLTGCQRYAIGVGRGGNAAPTSADGRGAPRHGQPGGDGWMTTFRASEEIQAYGGGGSTESPPTGAFSWNMDGGYLLATAGGAGNDGGGGGGAGASAPGGNASAAGGGTGGTGGAGTDVGALFPGLATTKFGGGGGGFGLATAGGPSDGGAVGGTLSADASSAVDGTGGGGGGGAQRGGVSPTFYLPGDGGDGVFVIDFPVAAATACAGGGSKTSGGSGSGGSGSGGSSATSTAVKATKPKVTAGGTAIDVSVTAPGAGTALLTGAPASAPKRVTCSASKSFTGTGSARMACVPGTGVQRLRRVRAVRVKLVVAFRPAAGGATQTLSVGTVTLPRVVIGPIPVTG